MAETTGIKGRSFETLASSSDDLTIWTRAPEAPPLSKAVCHNMIPKDQFRTQRRKSAASLSLLLCCLVLASSAASHASVTAVSSCSTDSDCPDAQWSCMDQVCIENTHNKHFSEETEAAPTNPYEHGCLYHHGLSKKLRVCNSDDPPGADQRGLCRIPDFDYMEIRLLSNNWESAVFETWILQIILSELLEVPTTTETADYDAKINFYDHDARFEFGGATELDAIRNSSKLRDCKYASRTADNYVPCAHVITEMWEGMSCVDDVEDGTTAAAAVRVESDEGTSTRLLGSNCIAVWDQLLHAIVCLRPRINSP